MRHRLIALMLFVLITTLWMVGCEEMADDAPIGPVAYDSTEVHHFHWDTLVVVEMNYDSTFIIRIDSIFVHHYDSVWVYTSDSVLVFDSTWVFSSDSIFIYDSVFVFNYDTVWVIQGSMWSDYVPIALDWQHYSDSGTVTNPAGNFVVGVTVKYRDPLPQGKEFLMEFGTYERRFRQCDQDVDTLWFYPGEISKDVAIRFHVVDVGCSAKPSSGNSALCAYYLEGVWIKGIELIE